MPSPRPADRNAHACAFLIYTADPIHICSYVACAIDPVRCDAKPGLFTCFTVDMASHACCVCGQVHRHTHTRSVQSGFIHRNRNARSLIPGAHSAMIQHIQFRLLAYSVCSAYSIYVIYINLFSGVFRSPLRLCTRALASD